MSSGTADTATMAGQWIETHAALFAVLVIAAVLLLVAVITLLVYCCCCRKKQFRWGGSSVKTTGSNLHVELHGDSVDASSAVTATIRGTNVLELHDEKEQYRSQLEQPPVVEHAVLVSTPEIVVSNEEPASLEAVQFQQSSDSELRAEFPPLPELPSGVEVTSDAELRLHSRTLPQVEAAMVAAVSASIAASPSVSLSASEGVEPAKQERSMRLPRTEVVLQTVTMQQHQQPLRSSPPIAAAVVVSAKAKSPETVTIRRVGDGRPSHEHRHGSSIYQSDDNEITIVDSDFSDYEDNPEDEERKRAKKSKSHLGLGLAADVSIVEANTEFGWEMLPNQPVTVEEPPIRAVDRQGEEYIPAPSPSLEEQQMRRVENLVELDRTLDVFEIEADVEAGGGGGGFGIDFSVGGRVEVGADMDLVDEEAILPLDRSQVPH